MKTNTFRAADSVTALEMVQKRLGDDALILSTSFEDGQVVIVATADAPDAAPRIRAEKETPRGSLVPLDAPLVPRVSVEVAGDVGAVTHLPTFLKRDAKPAFAEILAEIKEGSGPQDIPPARIDPITLRDRVLSASRVVLVGPAGAGKGHLALQLAAMRMTRLPDIRHIFFFCGTGSRGDSAQLAHKSHLLGMDTQVLPAGSLPPPEPGLLQIVVISAHGADPEAAAAEALAMPGAQGVLVLPAGLQPVRLAHVCARWTPHVCGAVLSAGRDMPVTPEERTDLTSHGIEPLWDALSCKLIGGLKVPESEETAAKSAAVACVENDRPVLFRHQLQGETRR